MIECYLKEQHNDVPLEPRWKEQSQVQADSSLHALVQLLGRQRAFPAIKQYLGLNRVS